MPVAYNPTPIDFSSLQNLGTIPQRLRERELRNQFSSGAFSDGNGGIDYNKMIEAIGGVNPLAAAKMAQDQAGNDTILDYMKYGLQEKEYQRKLDASRKPSPTDRKASREARKDVTTSNNLLTNLKEAKTLLEGGIHEGYGAGIAADIGTKLPFGASEWLGKQGLVDTQKAQRTQDYQNIVTPEAMQFMAEQLKGSTAFQEMEAFRRIYADPTVPNKTKAGLLGRLIRATEAKMATDQQIADEIEANPSGGGEAEYQEGDVADGPNGEVFVYRNGAWGPE